MILRLNTLFLLLLILIFSSCSDSPIACFENERDTVEVNETVLFQNCSTNSDQYNWNFGDSTLSTDIHPKHTYSDTGTYIVELTAYADLHGSLDRVEKTVLVVNSADKFIGNYIIEWENNNSLLSISHGLSVGSLVLSIDGTLFCNANSAENNIIINTQNYWNDDFSVISHGLGVLSNSNLVINIIVLDSDSNESIIQINAEKVPV